jgi:hypothetical protein
VKRITVELPDHFPLAGIADAVRVLGIGQLRYRCGCGLVAVHPEAHGNQHTTKIARKARVYKLGTLVSDPEVSL